MTSQEVHTILDDLMKQQKVLRHEAGKTFRYSRATQDAKNNNDLGNASEDAPPFPDDYYGDDAAVTHAKYWQINYFLIK